MRDKRAKKASPEKTKRKALKEAFKTTTEEISEQMHSEENVGANEIVENSVPKKVKGDRQSGERKIKSSPGNTKKTTIFDRTLRNLKKNKRARDYISIQRREIEHQVKLIGTRGEKSERGIVLLSHIPPGFYENEMKNYFNQFGDVTHIKLARSEKNGRSKGYAFIEFEHSVVAKIVAETMNNYLLFNRLLKAKYIQNKFPHFFWKKETGGKAIARRKQQIAVHNQICSPERGRKRLMTRLKNLDNVIKKLKAKGIEFSYKPTIHQQVDFPGTAGKFVCLPDADVSNSESNLQNKSDISANLLKPVLEIDESDDEIEFLIPPNVLQKKLSVSEPSSILPAAFGRNQKAKLRRRKRKIASMNSSEVMPENEDFSKEEKAVVKSVKKRENFEKDSDIKKYKGVETGKIIKKRKIKKDSGINSSKIIEMDASIQKGKNSNTATDIDKVRLLKKTKPFKKVKT